MVKVRHDLIEEWQESYQVVTRFPKQKHLAVILYITLRSYIHVMRRL